MRIRQGEYERAVKCGDSAMGLLRSGEIPPYPQYYELLYTYAAGVNPALNSRINELLKDGAKPDIASIEKLYSQFLRSRDLEERLRTASQEISGKIESVHGAIDDALDAADMFSGSLTAASGVLATSLSAEALADVAKNLLVETRQMQSSNRELEARLEEARNDISALKQDLDDVRHESLLDPLTKIYNRRCFDETITRSVGEANADGRVFALIMLDIDHFKAFNDNYGHQTGDQVLRLVASTIKSCVRESDTASRFGGEEFAVVLNIRDLEEASEVAEKIRVSIESKELLRRTTNEKLGRVTASMGVALFVKGDTVSSIVERADKCLYLAKKSGRNRVCDETQLAAAKSAKDERAA